jgi:hypothetical protein
MNIDQETGEVISKGRSPRFTLWVAFFAFATITMGSAVSVVSFYECHSNDKFDLIKDDLRRHNFVLSLSLH